MGPHNIISGMLEKMRMETQIESELLASHCYILRAHVVK